MVGTMSKENREERARAAEDAFVQYLISRMAAQQVALHQELRAAVGGEPTKGHIADALSNVAAAFEKALRERKLREAATAAVNVLILGRDLAYALGKLTEAPQETQN